MEKLLFEIGTEEIPAKFMPEILKQLQTLAENKLTEARIPFTAVTVCGTPRRMTFIAEGVALMQADTMVESKGPAVKIAYGADGTPSKALQGFARGQGVDLEAIEVRGDYVFAVKHLVGQKVMELLPDLLLDLLQTLTFPKTMRWADYDFRFVRPIRWLVALLGDQIIPVEITGVKAGNKTLGHRFLSQGELVIPCAADYEKILREHFVLVNPDERRTLIREQVSTLAQSEGGLAEIDEELLEEVTYLVEYPTALCGHFDEKFLSLPKEAVITPMREHQRYFPVFSPTGQLLAKFITVRNGGPHALAVVAHGNERVLRARLSDAEFFFNEDCKQTLENRLEKLKTVVFQDGLGNVYEKSQRLSSLAVVLRNSIGIKFDDEILKRTALLAKTDLVTGMVCEFTELQGVMGREYALRDGEKPEVAQGIFEHYLPRFAGDVLPSSTQGRCVSIADKLDNIAATFSRGLIPTGSQDPYALRRQAIGVINILLDAKYHISLLKTLGAALYLLNISAAKTGEILPQLNEFFRQRIKNMMLDQGIRFDVVDAVLAEKANDDVVDLFARAQALADYVVTPEAVSSVQAFTRVDNLCKKTTMETAISPILFVDPAEKALHDVVMRLHKEAIPAMITYDYVTVLQLVNEVAVPVNNFFDAVMVMDKDENVKNNRLALLEQVKELAQMVGDLSLIVM